jgi:pilus assembly protein Flp/PilA
VSTLTHCGSGCALPTFLEKTATRVTRPEPDDGRYPLEFTLITLFQTLHTLSYVVTDRVKALKDEKGASAVEYAILVGIIAAILVVCVAAFGGRLSAVFNTIKLS